MFEVFANALDRPAGEREAFLAESCGTDSALRGEIAELLAAHEGDGVLERPALPDTVVDAPPPEGAGADGAVEGEIGPYRLLRRLGEGGMGVVYEAQQSGALERRVALKLIRVGMDSREVVARFVLERTTLALLDHPNIARVYDAGATPAGRPYLVMELVEGRRIDRDCDERRLDVRQRVALVVTLCRAIEHAHRRGVLHRDIKPSNVLVADDAGRPAPKIIDFGIAKLLITAEGESPTLTEGGLIGTPEYMSPEQADGRRDLDTRTDVYALGVLLYQLVSGALPHDARRLRSGPLEARRILTQEEPRTPEAAFTALGDGTAEAAARRSCSVASLKRTLSGELRWALARAMEKDRERRYGSAAELAADLERYPRPEPLQAGPPSRLYRLRRLAVRHRVAVAAAAAVLLSLSLGLGASVLALRRATLARAEAERQAAVARAVSGFLTGDLLGSGAPHRPGDRELSVRELLDRTAARLEEDAQDPPVVEAGVRNALAEAYWGLGLRDVSLVQRERALRILTDAVGPEDPDTLGVSVELGAGLRFAGRIDEAQRVLEANLPVAERTLGPDHRTTLRLRRLEAMLAQSRGELEKSEAMLLPLLERVERAGDDTLLAAMLNTDLRTVEERLGRPDRVGRARKVYEAYRAHYGDDHDQTAVAMLNLAIGLARDGRRAEAEPLLRAVLDRHRRILGPEHPRTVMDEIALSGLLRLEGRLDEARQLAEEAFQASPAAFGGGDAFQRLQVETNLARALRAQGELAEAARHMRAVVAAARSELGPEHDMTARFVLDLGQVLAEMNAGDEAERTLLEAHRLLLGAVGPSHPFVAEAAASLADYYERRGAAEKARRWREGAGPG